MTPTFVRTHTLRALALFLPGLTAAVLVGACGKKGPPLAPVVATPARVAEVTPRRLGDTVFVRVAIPETNLDGTRPPNLDRIEVYAFTGRKTNDIRDLKFATLVGTIPVKRPVTAEQEEAWTKRGVAPPPNPGEPAGGVGVVSETLTPEMMIPVTPMAPRTKVVLPPPDIWSAFVPPLTGPVPEDRPRRFYAAVAVSRKNIKGPNSPRPSVALDAPPPAPRPVTAGFSERAITLTWEAPAEQRSPIQAPAEGEVLKSTAKGVAASVVYAYNVYSAPGGATPPDSAAALSSAQRQPLNPKPLTVLTFEETTFEFGRERCYVVRAVDGGVESDPTPPACVTPLDRFAPPAPGALAAVASEGAVSLIWEGVDAADLAGYIVLRGQGPNAPLLPLFDTPIRQTAYRDDTAKPGVRYVYAVAAVDTATPRNVSAPSNRVEESAR